MKAKDKFKVSQHRKNLFQHLVRLFKIIICDNNFGKLAGIGFLLFSGHLFAQIPNTCAGISHRANSNGGANSCPNVSGTAYASNFVGTAYATVPASSKTGDLQFSYAGANPSLLPLAITNVWLTTTGTVLQSTAFGPAGVPTVSGGNTLVNYCFYGSNLPTAGTLSFQLTDPQTGIVRGICSYDASCNTSCTVVANPSVLPVIFTYFEAVQGQGTSVRLKWVTAQEQNNKGFDIQRSVTNNAFTSIAFVPTANPRGNSSVQTEYEFTDLTVPEVAEVTYRLRQIDLDGNAVYSSVITVGINYNPTGIRAYSSGGILNISIPASSGSPGAEVTVFDTQGKKIRRERIATAGDFRISSLPGQSVYFIVVVPNNGGKRTSAEVYIW
jgi:hypothetical protein